MLKRLTANLKGVVLRLADPREYRGNKQQVEQAIKKLNKILMIEGLRVELEGVSLRLKEIAPQFVEQVEEAHLQPLPPPDFLKLKVEPGLGEILAGRWDEAQRCLDGEAYLAATIIMGSMLEGMLLAALQKFPKRPIGGKQHHTTHEQAKSNTSPNGLFRT